MSIHELPDKIVFSTILPTGERIVQEISHPRYYQVTGGDCGVIVDIYCEKYTVSVDGEVVESKEKKNDIVSIRGDWDSAVCFRFDYSAGPRPEICTTTMETFIARIMGFTLAPKRGPRPVGPRPIA